MQVTVVGAGVIGLATALALEERGHAVRIVAAAGAESTVSSVAGAVWFPFRAGPPDRVAQWAARTRRWLEEIAQRPGGDTGVEVLDGYEITTDEGPAPPLPWWAAGIEVSRAPAPVAGAPVAWRFRAPRVEPARFLPWITGQLRASVERRAVPDLQALAAEPGDAVVNCTGLGARALTGDQRLEPLFGQVVITERGGADLGVTVTDDRDPEAPFYIVPRRDELVLGGVARPWPPGAAAPAEVDPAVTVRILGQARAFGLAIGPVRAVRAGLRPFRPEVRLERDPDHPRVIHNYGHGGAGYTLSRGCALDAAELVERAT